MSANVRAVMSSRLWGWQNAEEEMTGKCQSCRRKRVFQGFVETVPLSEFA